MSTAPPLRTAPGEIEHLFQIALYLLLVTGFATLAATGKLDAISVVTVVVALVLRGSLLLRDVQFVIPRRVTSWLAVVYALTFFVDFFLISDRDFVPPAVHLVLFGICIKMFNIERDRDYAYLAVLSFLMVLSASILTVDSAFLAAFALFLVLAVFCFMAMEMRRSARAAGNVATLSIPGLRTRRRQISPVQRLSASLARTTAVVVISILASGTLLFFAMPRINGGYFGRRTPNDIVSTGFSDSVNLGDIGRIQQSSLIVAHIRIDGDTTGSHDLRLRGTVLTDFDGKRWTHPRHESDSGIEVFNGLAQLAARNAEMDRREAFRIARGSPVDHLHYRVLMEPLSTSVIFTVPTAQAIFGQFREIAFDEDRVFHNLDHDRSITAYEGISDASVPQPVILEKLPALAQPVVPPRYLQLPTALDPRIPALAREITGKQRSTYLQALAIENYLKTKYGYTLELPSRAVEDPLADFLFRRHEGHCEYFASSMAVLLRTVGIPSRVITGFHGAQFNQYNSTYIVQASNAHSWVEAYIPGAGWVTFDPTPASLTPIGKDWSRAQLYIDAAREFWREWVVNYDAMHQQALSASGMHQGRQLVVRFREWAAARYRRMLDAARSLHRTATHNPERLLQPGMSLLLLVACVLLPWAAIRVYRAFRASSTRISPGTASAIFYLRLVRLLARCGYRRAPSQTAAELAQSIREPELQAAVMRFGSAYERARFGGSAADAAELPGLLNLVRLSRKQAAR